MLLFRLILMVLLLAAVVCFALFTLTAQPHWRQRGLRLVRWALAAALAFAGVLLIERLILWV